MKKVTHTLTHQGSTLFLRIALSVVGIVIGILCFLIVRAIHGGFNDEYPALTHLRYPLLALITLSTVPFYYAIGQAFVLLRLIDRNKAFSRRSVKALRNIMTSAFVFSGLYAVCLYIVFQIAQAEDAPGLILIIGSIFVGVPLAVGVFMAVLSRLLQSALEIKSENDLTV